MNEYIAGCIGQFLRLPIPPFAISSDVSGGRFFTSLDFNFDAVQLPPIIPDLCWAALPDLSTGVVLFDILIANSDRHDENLATNRQASPTELRVFDHDQALFGGGLDLKGIERLDKLSNRLAISGGTITQGNCHCLLREMNSTAYMASWHNRIDCLPDWFLSDVCEEARQFGLSKEETTSVTEFLKCRRNGLREIIKNNRDMFLGITDWPKGLFD